jgi:hypothetical protein
MARQAQLVSQHLENISHEALSKYQDVIRSYVRVGKGFTRSIERTNFTTSDSRAIFGVD